MSTKVLTLKYRPQIFAELIVQDHVKRTLIRAIEHERFANAYLFTGPRGVGKTTTARLLAKSLNCLARAKPTPTPCNECSACSEIAASRSLDVLEIDGASNRGIDQVRELRENIKYAPTSLRYKVYIIDEVHMLTPQAFNALLKTLEEPPAHAKFIFATTAAHDVPATIVSRCQRFDFRKATDAEVAGRLSWLAGQEKITVSEPALLAIARRADGAIRDGESILEQLATYQPDGIELSDVEELLGLVPSDLVFDFTGRLISGDAAEALADVGRVVEQGHDLLEFFSALVRHFRNLLLAKAGRDADRADLTRDEKTRLAEQAARADTSALIKALDVLLQNEQPVKQSQLLQFSLEGLALNLIEVLAERPRAVADEQTGTPARGPDKVAPSPPRSQPRRDTTEKKSAPPAQQERRPSEPESPPARTGPAPAERSGGLSEQPLGVTPNVWREIVLKTKGRKPRLGRFLESCSAESAPDGRLTILHAAGTPEIAKALEGDRALLERIVASVTGRETAITIKPESPTFRARPVNGDAKPEVAPAGTHAARKPPDEPVPTKDKTTTTEDDPGPAADREEADLARITGVLGSVERVTRRR